LNGLRNQLKLNNQPTKPKKEKIPKAFKAAADSCCGDKPYSSATSQCCIGRVIPLSDNCCLNGKAVSSDHFCSCSPPVKWSKIETERLSKFSNLVGNFNSILSASIAKREIDQKVNKQQIFELDQKGSQLFDRFCELIGLEKGDPECGLVYSTISNPKTNSNSGSRNRFRRNYRSQEEYIPPEYLPEYEPEYNGYLYDIESDMLYDYVHVEDYQEEPDDEEAHIEQVHEIAYERRRIKEEMEKLGVKQNQILDTIEVLHMSKMATLAIKGPVQNSENLMNTQLDFAYMMSEQSDSTRQCGTSSWNDHVQTLINTLLSAIDKADAVIQDEKLEDLHDNLLHVQYYHENYKRTYSDYEAEELEE